MENYEKAESDYIAGMKYKDIADKYGTSINTVKSWKQRYHWNRDKKSVHTKDKKVCTQNKSGASISNIQIDDGTKETLRNDRLTPEQQLFCIYYSRTFNATQSYLSAYKCDYATANAHGYGLLSKVVIKEEIERLKEIKRRQIVASPEDIVELQMRIAFGDIGNVLHFGKTEIEAKNGSIIEVSRVNLKESTEVDTQLIESVKEGRDGVSIKLKDPQKAIDWLTKYFLIHPESKYRAEYEKKRAEVGENSGEELIKNMKTIVDVLQHPAENREISDFEGDEKHE